METDGIPKPRRKRSPLAVRRATSELSENIRVWRKLRGLTQAQLADRADVSARTVARLEEGAGSGVGLGQVLRVLRALGVLEIVTRALDPYESDVGRLRADEQLPQRVRPRNLSGEDDE